MSITHLLLAIAGMLLLGAGHYGLQFYPPGWGYEEEKRNNRIAALLLIAAIACILIVILKGRVS